MNVLLWLAAGIAAVEGISVATSGVDVFYPAPLPPQSRTLPALEWAAGALLLGAAAARSAGPPTYRYPPY